MMLFRTADLVIPWRVFEIVDSVRLSNFTFHALSDAGLRMESSVAMVPDQTGNSHLFNPLIGPFHSHFTVKLLAPSWVFVVIAYDLMSRDVIEQSIGQ